MAKILSKWPKSRKKQLELLGAKYKPENKTSLDDMLVDGPPTGEDPYILPDVDPYMLENMGARWSLLRDWEEEQAENEVRRQEDETNKEALKSGFDGPGAEFRATQGWQLSNQGKCEGLLCVVSIS